MKHSTPREVVMAGYTCLLTGVGAGIIIGLLVQSPIAAVALSVVGVVGLLLNVALAGLLVGLSKGAGAARKGVGKALGAAKSIAR